MEAIKLKMDAPQAAVSSERRDYTDEEIRDLPAEEK
jgi:hypothetical protein